MLNLSPLFEFSRYHCVAICSFLVPAILAMTITTLVLVVKKKPLSRILWSKRIALVLEISLFLHVSTWFIIGVITPVTFILFGLGTTCLLLNSLGVAYRHEIARLFAERAFSTTNPIARWGKSL